MEIKIEDFFEIKNFRWKKIFNNLNFPWEAIPNISQFVQDRLDDFGMSKVFLDKGTIIQDTARIEGSAIVGKNCMIGHGVLIRNDVIIGDNVSIGHGVEVKHSIVMNNTSIAHLNYVGDSVIGSRVNISGGAILANWRFDKQKIKIKINEEFIQTGLEKLGAIVGDNCTIGVNSVLNPGTVLGKNSFVYPLVSVAGFQEENSILKKINV